MKKSVIAILLAICMVAALLSACGSSEAAASAGSAAASAAEVQASEASAPEEEPAAEAPAEAPEPEASEEPAVEEDPAAEAPAEAEEPEAEEPEEAAEPEPEEAPEPAVVTVTFSDGQTFEATVGEDFVFFFQCDAPGDMGEPEEGEEGAGITTSDGTATYSNVGLGGPFRYPTSELVTISGFTGDFTITITEAATNMDATYTIYTDPQEIEDAIAFAEAMAAAQAANPMP